MTIQAGDIVIRRSQAIDAGKKRMRVDGFVLDAMGKKWAALSDPENNKGMGCLKIGQIKLAEEAEVI